MSLFDTNALNEFYTRISVTNGMSIADFQGILRGLFERSRSGDDLNNYRLSKQPWKKLADEVTPVSRFLQFRGVDSGRIRFPLDNHPPDCWLWKANGGEPLGMEVTIAQATERHHLKKELVDKGRGRGFIGVSDDAPRVDFNRAMSKQRVMYTTDHALSAIRDGILRCLSRKNKPKYTGFNLLIEAPLRSLPQERWEAIMIDLRTAQNIFLSAKYM